ncbi:MAG: hypothetical protein A3B68_06590 [Candidatus Melainabacteria bacterium RIFCSPHIGHO2_02_FULL_34_12]|nr:MAG: hypothetical protein A3B68_06590 [Candidatus Melainabacteria bacterium RIFCSPHIGHO2_02_FULL_34_12]
MSKVIGIILTVVMIFTWTYSPTFAEDSTDELCNQFCTDKEKFETKYKSGKMKPVDGKCAEGEEEQDLCCCK